MGSNFHANCLRRVKEKPTDVEMFAFEYKAIVLAILFLVAAFIILRIISRKA